MTFSFHSISDKRAERASEPGGKGSVPQDVPINIPGDTPKWEEGIVWLYRVLGKERRERAQDTEQCGLWL